MTNNIRRYVHFDLLRILAMLMVVLFHYTTQYSKTVMETTFVLYFTEQCAAFGVSLFLLMVGFFSYKELIKDETGFVQYIVKRAIRLLPTFWLCLIITSIVLVCTGTTNVSLKQFVLNAVLLNRFFNIPFVDGVYWYMLVLVAFTCFVAVAKLLKQFNRRIYLYVAYTVLFVLVGFINRFVRQIPTIISFAAFEYINKCLIGLVLAFIAFKRKDTERRYIIAALIISILLVSGEFLWIENKKALVEIISILLFALVVFFGDRLKFGENVSSIITKIADETYFVYLFHQQIGFIIMKYLISAGVNANLAVALAIFAIAIAAFIHYIGHQYIHIPLRKLAK